MNNFILWKNNIANCLMATGYRDAECGWVMVGEENHHELDHPKSSLRTALFLVIYATKRGILEVSCSTFMKAQNGAILILIFADIRFSVHAIWQAENFPFFTHCKELLMIINDNSFRSGEQSKALVWLPLMLEKTVGKCGSHSFAIVIIRNSSTACYWLEPHTKAWVRNIQQFRIVKRFIIGLNYEKSYHLDVSKFVG